MPDRGDVDMIVVDFDGVYERCEGEKRRRVMGRRMSVVLAPVVYYGILAAGVVCDGGLVGSTCDGD